MKPQNPLRGRARGIGLAELLIGLAVGSLIVAGALTVFAKISFSGLENVRMVRLTEQLRTNLGVIRRDLQRAGYVDAWETGVATEISHLKLAEMGVFGTVSLGGTCADGDGDGANECDCISYSYDRDRDFVQDPDEIFAFRLNGTEIERDTLDATCAGGAGWQAVTDDEVNIEVLTFELDPGSTITELDDGVGNDDGICESGEVCLARRKINVVLEGSLAADSDFTVRLRDDIKVKNDHYYTMP
ncbi:hypothetical protein A9Q90_05975 [Gammaproteobacteria bacterium 54_18_T64]|nr:hypothetical protein A9Q90_05975 [Gammaproteobacteria bacterium 54_18_T64]